MIHWISGAVIKALIIGAYSDHWDYMKRHVLV